MARFVEQTRARAGAQYELGLAITTLGRDGENTIVLLDERVSRRHAQVSWDGTQYVLADLGSRNGTYLNGRPVTTAEPLKHGDQVGLGDTRLMFDAADETAPARAALAPGSLRLDPVTAEVWRGGEQIKVTAKEYLALRALQDKAGGLVSKEELAARVWPEYQGGVGDYNIEQLISRLRRKIEPQPDQPQHLLTVRGLGYRLML